MRLVIFKTLYSEMELTSAMLYYLDGVYNNGRQPQWELNARELVQHI